MFSKSLNCNNPVRNDFAIVSVVNFRSVIDDDDLQGKCIYVTLIKHIMYVYYIIEKRCKVAVAEHCR